MNGSTTRNGPGRRGAPEQVLAVDQPVHGLAHPRYSERVELAGASKIGPEGLNVSSLLRAKRVGVLQVWRGSTWPNLGVRDGVGIDVNVAALQASYSCVRRGLLDDDDTVDPGARQATSDLFLDNDLFFDDLLDLFDDSFSTMLASFSTSTTTVSLTTWT